MRVLNTLGARIGLALVLSVVGSGSSRAATANNCGCYKDTDGICFCAKKAKCGCPGDCEPKGCEEQRDKEIQKEIDAETKKAEAAEASQSKRSAGDEDQNSPDPEPESPKAESPKLAPSASNSKTTGKTSKMSAAQVKQLAKLIDLYLADHKDARGKSLEDVRNDVR
jgi:pyruvate/2-oxoglutarate dehydrogenase complex dihydrolipoamide acyltransferase (E2) component